MLKKGFLILFAFLFSCSYLITAKSAYLPPARGSHAMIATEQAIATKIGLQILKNGGNAIDAAVAIGYVLAVVQPCCGNIGGGGFMVIHLANGKNAVINFREKAPQAITDQVKSLKVGYPSVGVPGTVMGLNAALKQYGTLSLSQVMAPAIALAKNGFILRRSDSELLKQFQPRFQAQPNIAKIFLPQGKLLTSGDRLIQTHLAKTLTLISNKGTKAFYKGPIAKAIVEASQTHHGYLSMSDFANYHIQIQKPITCTYRDYQIITNPPPGSGVVVCEILMILNGYPLKTLGFHSALSAHYNIEAMRYAFADRNQYLGDPDFVKNPIQKLLSLNYIESIRKQILPFKAGDSNKIGIHLNQNKEKRNTSAYTVIDKEGNAVAVTYTLNGFFGSVLMAGNTGFFLNNELDDFSLKKGEPNQFGLVHGTANVLQPNKRPLSSMSPSILIKNNRVNMVIAASGGPTIITSIVEAIENKMDYGMDINAAINSPRFHMQWLPDRVYVEPFTFSKDTIAKLLFMGYHFKEGFFKGRKTWASVQGATLDDKTYHGASDNRTPSGLAKGY